LIYKPIVLPLAKQDIQEIALWYNSKQKGLGKRLTLELRQKVKFISQNPQAVAVRYADVRTTVLDVFPFMIHFTIEEDKKRVVISAVFHTSLNPKNWKKR
jgi:plasmid stabilization system protein ParE